MLSRMNPFFHLYTSPHVVDARGVVALKGEYYCGLGAPKPCYKEVAWRLQRRWDMKLIV